MLSRKEMEDIIVNRKQSVFISGYGIIDKVENLPSEAILAKGNKEATKTAKESLKAQMEALKKDLASLDEEPEEEKVVEKDKGEVDTSEEDARKAEVARRSEADVKNEEARKAEEEKKAAAVKKEADARNK